LLSPLPAFMLGQTSPPPPSPAPPLPPPIPLPLPPPSSMDPGASIVTRIEMSMIGDSTDGQAISDIGEAGSATRTAWVGLFKADLATQLGFPTSAWRISIVNIRPRPPNEVFIDLDILETPQTRANNEKTGEECLLFLQRQSEANPNVTSTVTGESMHIAGLHSSLVQNLDSMPVAHHAATGGGGGPLAVVVVLLVLLVAAAAFAIFKCKKRKRAQTGPGMRYATQIDTPGMTPIGITSTMVQPPGQLAGGFVPAGGLVTSPMQVNPVVVDNGVAGGGYEPPTKI